MLGVSIVVDVRVTRESGGLLADSLLSQGPDLDAVSAEWTDPFSDNTVIRSYMITRYQIDFRLPPLSLSHVSGKAKHNP